MSHFDIYSSYSIFAPKYIPLVDLIVDFLARKFNYSLKVVKWDFLQGFSTTVKEEVSLPLKLNKSEKNPFSTLRSSWGYGVTSPPVSQQMVQQMKL